MEPIKPVQSEIIEAGDKPESQDLSIVSSSRRLMQLDRPLVTPEEAVKAWQEYCQLEREILSDDDYVWFCEWVVGDKVQRKGFPDRASAEELARRVNGTVVRRKKKSGYRKLAQFFGFTLPVTPDGSLPHLSTRVEQLGDKLIRYVEGPGIVGVIYMDSDLRVLKADFTVTVMTPSGRLFAGEGSCSLSERGFKHPDHDIPATAATRALNRAISDALGLGEVSAEELLEGAIEGEAKVLEPQPESVRQPESTPKPPQPAPRASTGNAPVNLAELLSKAMKHGLTVDQVREVLGEDLSQITDFRAAWEKLQAALKRV